MPRRVRSLAAGIGSSVEVRHEDRLVVLVHVEVVAGAHRIGGAAEMDDLVDCHGVGIDHGEGAVDPAGHVQIATPRGQSARDRLGADVDVAVQARSVGVRVDDLRHGAGAPVGHVERGVVRTPRHGDGLVADVDAGQLLPVGQGEERHVVGGLIGYGEDGDLVVDVDRPASRVTVEQAGDVVAARGLIGVVGVGRVVGVLGVVGVLRIGSVARAIVFCCSRRSGVVVARVGLAAAPERERRCEGEQRLPLRAPSHWQKLLLQKLGAATATARLKPLNRRRTACPDAFVRGCRIPRAKGERWLGSLVYCRWRFCSRVRSKATRRSR